MTEFTVTYRDAGDILYLTWLMLVKDLVIRHYPEFSAESSANHGMYAVVASTLTTNHLSTGRRAEPEGMEQFARLLNDLELCDSCLEGPKSRCSSLDSHEEYSSVLDEIFEVLRANHGCDRKFFITRDGGVGLGPSSMCADDVVVILRGGDVPFIMRQSGEF